MIYSYWLLRYVPDTIRGEMVNVGVLVGRDGGDWALRRVSSFSRAGRLGGDANRVAPWLEWLGREIDDYQRPPLESFVSEQSGPFTAARVHRLQVRLNNAIQISAPTGVQGDSAASTAEFLYEFLVSEATVPTRSSTRRRLVSQLRAQYDQVALHDVVRTLETRPQARVGLQRGRFDFAVVNDEVNQLSQVWSFDLTDMDKLEQDIHAWSYLVTRLRDDGGELGPKQGLSSRHIGSDVPISAVYQVPSGKKNREDQMRVFLAAQEAWNNLGVDLVPSEELDRVAKNALISV